MIDSFNGVVFIYKILRGYWTVHTKIFAPRGVGGQGFGYKTVLDDRALVVATAVNDGKEITMLSLLR